ncbi:WG repeat-containing protein [Carboxylicivirga sp. M1479]|uniref:WG repeat-containing protein n=1 Tax=Carboxylicivirga sp. M1479 TaxID=2594476 RepID=UPI001177EC6E|nr:WG repeat-containing protein [Carboxylicivirga sp. M1479]TRX71017.1 WG repeat-containing protein [Carboxylicivirga sp. M1479]
MKHKENGHVGLMVFILLITIIGCSQQVKEDYLIKVFEGASDEVGVKSGYVNSRGDTIIALGKYYYCYTDTLKNLAIVLKKGGACVAIDRNQRELFELFWYDNGPDDIVEGLFRIKKNGKIGYANLDGEIVIKPQYACAFPFKDGKAKVAYNCNTSSVGEYSKWDSDHWIYIDKSGKEIE